MTFPQTETVNEYTITTKVLIRKFTYEDGTVQYDWIGGSEDSDEWFDTAEDAEYDARMRLGD